jgi:hypothetical protein
MNTLHKIIVAGLLCACSAAYAVPVAFQFSGIHSAELIEGYSPAPPPTYLFAEDSVATLSFLYDAATLHSRYVPSYDGSAPYYVYEAALTNLTGTVPGYSFSAVSDRTKFYPTVYSFGTFDMSAQVSSVYFGKDFRNYQGDGLTGFSVLVPGGFYHLVGFSLLSFHWGERLPDGVLPDNISNIPIGSGTGLDSKLTLVFESAWYDRYEVQYTGAITAVPLPAAGVLFGPGLLLLMAARFRRVASGMGFIKN